ncbi:MAG: DUF1330 domain-containing protein [Fibrobacteria bacterium]
MLYINVHLFGGKGYRGEFLEYEAKALEVFRRHGGEVVVAYAPVPAADGAETPDEIQVLRIPDRKAFDAFMQDPVRMAMAAERDAVIRKTEVFFSETLILYGSAAR